MACGSTFSIEGVPDERLPRRFNGSCKCQWCRMHGDRLPCAITIPSGKQVEPIVREVICQRAGARVYWRICSSSSSSSYRPAAASRDYDGDADSDVEVAMKFRPAEPAEEQLLQAPDAANACPWSTSSASSPPAPPDASFVSPKFVAPSCGVLVLSLTCTPSQSWSNWSGNKKAHIVTEVHYDGDAN